MQATPLLLTTLLAAGAAAPDVDFDTDVIPVLTRAGCNAGACHGAAAGRGGFRLSLFGSDPEFDHRSIVRELEGRRVNLASPDESLLLLKPTSAVRHGGGARLDLEGEGADLLRRWIASGAARAKARRLLDLRVSPEVHVADRPGGSVPLRATARFDDGSSRDVTRWTVFTPEDPSAVAIDGRTATAQLLRRGRHVIVARYLDRVVPVQVIVPLSDRPVDLTREPRRNFIDGHILELLTKLRLPVSPPADDATFLRRVTLDLTGRLPTPEQVFAFAGDGRPDKRDRLIDRLLASEEFNDYWTYRLAGLLRIRSGAHDGTGVRTYHRWLREQVASGAPYDRIARELLTAEGDAHAVGPANFYRTTGDARQQAEFVSELFLGSRLRCANCHNHPLDRWTQDDYHGLAAVFARVERGRVVRLAPRGEVMHPRTGEAAVPRIPGVRFLESDGDSRAALAEWLTRPDNPYFARAMVNRLWKSLMGRGLVEPTDDLRATNPATHPALLDELAADFVAHGYDLRHTLRLIAQSHAYARSSRSLPAGSAGPGADDRYYSHALARPLEPEVLADAIADVTGVPGRYGDHPPGTRAVTLTDPQTPSAALDVLGRCSREETCEAAGGTPGGLPRMLHLYNGPLLNARITDPEGRLRKQLAAGRSPEAIISDLYLRALGRAPSPEERRFWAKQIADASGAREREELLEDFLWGLLNCREFLTNH